jgi:hypothetical protein
MKANYITERHGKIHTSKHAVGDRRRSTNRQEQSIPNQKKTIQHEIIEHNLRLVSKGFQNNISLVLCYQGLTKSFRILIDFLIFCELFGDKFVKLFIVVVQ